jgi:hypothetical protein
VSECSDKQREGCKTCQGKAEICERVGKAFDEPCRFARSSTGASEDAKDVTIRHWVQRALAAEGAIADHNNGLLEACGKTSNHPHVKESRRCDSRRDCPDCPRDWHVAVDQSALPSANGDTDVPICDGHADIWFTGRNHLIGDHDCVVCACMGWSKKLGALAPADGGVK